jgi:uncharacterized protein
MPRKLPTLLMLMLCPLLLTACGMTTLLNSYQAASLDGYPVDAVIIRNGESSYPFTVWVADTDARRLQGLMYQDELDDDCGMLFLFDQPTRPAMWMKDTTIPLDFLFISADGKIISMACDQPPDSTLTIQPELEVTGILELPGGAVARLHLETGGRVEHPHFQRLLGASLASPAPHPPLHSVRN